MVDYPKAIVGGIMTLIFFAFAYFAYLLFYTPPYFDTKQPFKLEKTEYHMGETLTYYSEYCKYREYIPLRIERSLVDGFVYPLPTAAKNSSSLGVFPIGCRTVEVDVPLMVPMRVPTGVKYHVEIIIEYKINALRSEIRSFKTEDFTLLPALPII